MPYDHRQYDPLWLEKIRPDILKRDNYHCSFCGVPHKSYIHRERNGKWYQIPIADLEQEKSLKVKIVRIILVIAHMDHNIKNNDYNNLRALRQRCHLNYDRPIHKVLRKATFAAKRRQLRLFVVEPKKQKQNKSKTEA